MYDALCSTADTMLAGNLAETMKLEPYQIYQTSPPASHQQQTGPPPPYYEAQYQRNNGLRTPSSASYGLPPTPQSANQQRCPIHGLQPCACQMVSLKIFDVFFTRGRRDPPQRRTSAFLCCACSAWQCCKINKDRDVCFIHTHTHTYAKWCPSSGNFYIACRDKG